MTTTVRPGTAADAEGMARVHFAAVQGTASPFYPPAVIESWTRAPDQERQEQFRRAMAGGEVFVVAEDAQRIVGFGSLAPGSQEVRAVYVDPGQGRRGIGRSILAELERLAAANGSDELRLDSSLNAEAFYSRHGYEVVERGSHRLGSGVEMACVRMKKSLRRPG